MRNGDTFEAKIAVLDTSLFRSIKSQTTEADRGSLLAIQRCVRDSVAGYSYLEIGSYLGGSIQPHLLDPSCHKIYSIDKRESLSRDERVEAPAYPENSRQHMLALLAGLDPEAVRKVECLDGDVLSISPSLIVHAPDLCFIDGEHTPAAVARDFEFCARVCAPGATIVFHDAQTVFRGIRSVVRTLSRAGKPFGACALSDMIYCISFDGSTTSALTDKFPLQIRGDDLWSLRNDLRLMKWRAIAFRDRVSQTVRQSKT
jgi:hypothetical protein